MLTYMLDFAEAYSNIFVDENCLFVHKSPPLLRGIYYHIMYVSKFQQKAPICVIRAERFILQDELQSVYLVYLARYLLQRWA